MRNSDGYGSEKSDFWIDEMPRLVELLRKSRSAGAAESGKQRTRSLRQVAEVLEPSYDSFYCPITRKIMEDPVTVADGSTYERRAIAAWFEENGPVCPSTRAELGSSEMEGNAALRTTISEWRKKSEVVRIKLACVALMLASPNSMVLEAIRDLQRLCRRRPANIDLARGMGAMRLLGQFLELEGSKTRCEALRALTFFAGDEDGKEKVVGTKKIDMTVRLLSSDDPSELDAAVSFLLELSKSVAICRRIGLVPGAILMLLTLKYQNLREESLADKVDKCLENLEKFPSNIMIMAEDGYLDPLLRNLVEGSEETKLDMANLLGKLILPQHAKGHVSSAAISTLLGMVRHPELEARMAALHALAQLSSHPSNATLLVQFGAVPLMVETMFTGSTLIVPSSTSAWHHHHSAILADALDYLDDDPESIVIDSQGHTMTSHYAIYNLVNMLSPTASHELSLNVVRILLSLTASKSKKPADRIAKVVRETDYVTTIVKFTCSGHEPLVVASLKLLIKLSPHLGTAISEKLCEAPGQPDMILAGLKSVSVVGDRHIASAELLARLPQDNLPLNKVLIAKGAIPLTLACIDGLQSNGRAVVSRQGKLFLEGLVGILVRFTTTCHDTDICNALVEREIAKKLTNLLGSANDEEILTLSTLGLRNLSMVTKSLLKPGKAKRKSTFSFLTCCFGSHDRDTNTDTTCRVHGGMCSSRTFCLVKTCAVDRLLACMEHESDEVVSGALAALRTLVEGDVDVVAGIMMLGEYNGVRLVLGIVREERGEEVKMKALWMVERFLMSGIRDVLEEIENDRLLGSFLVKGLHHGDREVRNTCENILRYLNRMPKHSRRDRTTF